MRTVRFLLVLVLASLPLAVAAALKSDDLPGDSSWYIHIDLEEMRTTEAGKSLYAWLESEVLDEVEDESGVDLGREVDNLTAFSLGEDGFVMIMNGRFSQETRDKAMAAAATAERFDTRKSGGKVYHRVQNDEHASVSLDNGNVDIEGLTDEMFFSFDLKNKLVATSSEAEMKALLANGGKVSGQKSHAGALFVISAESSLIQAGLNTENVDSGDDEGFKSNVMRNTKQIAVLVADVAGKVAIEAQLLASEAETAESLASIVRGLIALQIFSDDMDPEIAEFLRNTRVDVDDTLLKVSVALSPASVQAVLDEA